MTPEEPRVDVELLELIASACNEQLAPAEEERLAKLLTENPKARKTWIEFSRLHVELYISSASQCLLRRSNDVIDDLIQGLAADNDSIKQTKPKVQPVPAAPRLSRWAGWSVAAAAILLSSIYLGLQSFLGLQSPNASETSMSASAMRTGDTTVAMSRYAERTRPDAVAVLTRQNDAVWGGDSSWSVGSPLAPMNLSLLSGNAQIDMLSGVNLILQGPANISLVDPMQVVCHNGRVRASVPDGAEGFVVKTPSHRAIDLGTVFAVSVESSNESEIHVIEGEVVVQPVHADPSETETTKLTTGQAIRSRADGILSRIPANAEAFLDAEKLMEQSRRHERRQSESWAAAEKEFRGRDDLVLYYSFQGHKDWEKELRQDGLRNLGSLHGGIVGCNWSEGRFSRRRSLEFKGTEDRIRTRVPGEFDSLSFSIWVRIDGLDREYSSLFMTVGHDLGEPHWQINERGELVLGIKGYSNDYYGPPFNSRGNPMLNHNYSTGTVVGPNDLGVWMNLTSVFDAEHNEVRHYKDGVRKSTEKLVREVKLRLGDCEIGNWTPVGGTHVAIRALNGRIDELAIFDRALGDDEILELYLSGRP